MATIAQINDEIARWQSIAADREKEVQTLEGQLDRLAPNGAIDFRNLEKYTRTKDALFSARAKRDGARGEVSRLQDAVDELHRQIAELGRNRDNYLRQLEPGALDWSKVDQPVNREAHYAELSAKAADLEGRIEAIYG